MSRTMNAPAMTAEFDPPDRAETLLLRRAFRALWSMKPNARAAALQYLVERHNQEFAAKLEAAKAAEATHES